jgi:hypothetical protein
MQMQQIGKKKAGVVGDLINGTGGLIIGVIVILVIVSTLLGANLLTSGSEYANVSNRMASNFTAGIDQVSGKIPTILLIGAVVLLFGVILLLVRQSQAMGIGGRSGGSL